MAKVEWTDDFEQKLRTKLESEYKQADNMVVWASRCDRPLQKGLIEVEKSADSMIKWIKKELELAKGKEHVSEIDFEQELYKYFGQIKDFTLGMRIAKRFYDMGRQHQKDFRARYKRITESDEFIRTHDGASIGDVIKVDGEDIGDYDKKAVIDAAMKEVEEKSKAFTEAHKGQSADEILAEMRGEEPVNNDFEMALAEMIDKAQTSVVEPLVIAAQWKDELIKLAKSEEPVSEEWVKELRAKLDSLSKEDFKKVFDKYAVDFNEEPMSEDLEKAAKECAFNLQLQEYFKKGAQWKEKQMKEKCSKLIQISFNNGVEIGRNEMKRDAKEAHVIMTHVTKDSVVPSLSAVTLDDSYKEGDKVKVLILKG